MNTCSYCNNAHANVKCAICSTPYCGNECAIKDIGHTCESDSLRFFDGNYINGTRADLTLYRNGFLSSGGGISRQYTQEIFDAIDVSKFHVKTVDDHAQCCDVPYTVFYYGNMIASAQDVPELYETWRRLLDKPRTPPKTRMRVYSSMPRK